MTNFSFHQPNLFSALAFFLLSTVLLQGCGADRAEPFNAPETNCSSSSTSSSSFSDFFSSSSLSSTSSSSSSNSSCSSSSYSSSSSSSSSKSSSSSSLSSASSSAISTLEITELWRAEETATVIVPNSKTEFEIDDYDEFNEVIAKYVVDPSKLVEPESGYFNDGKVFVIYGGEIDSCKSHWEFNDILSAIDVSDISVKITIGYNEVKGRETCTPDTSHPFRVFHITTSKKLGFEDDIKQ